MRDAGLVLLVLCLAGCAGSGPRGGRAAGDGPRGEEGGARTGMLLNPAGLMIAGCDSDGDYHVTMAELDAGAARGFAAADRDGDGMLSPIELSDWRLLAFGAADALPGPFAFDVNQDGKVSAAEFAVAIRDQAADYMGEDGTIAFSALTREADLGGRFRRGDAPSFDLQPRGGQGGEPPL